MLRGLQKFKRSRKIVGVLAKYGFGHLIDRAKIGVLAKIGGEDKAYRSFVAPKRLRLAFEELGPTFIKFGQILSTRPDFLPPAFTKELEKLQDEAPPFHFSKVREILENELGEPLDKLFETFETRPIAAASLSQVHKATLLNGETVAVKVQRPAIEEIIKLDLSIFEELAGFLESRLYNGWIYRPKLMVEEFKKAILKELDFVNEAHNFERFRENFKSVDYVRVPIIYRNMTTMKVLTMEFIRGVKINEIVHEKYRGVLDFNFKETAERGAGAMLKQIFEDGFFHADPHSANILVRPPATIVMLDAGMVGYLDDKTIMSGAKLIRAIRDKNMDQAIISFENVGLIIKEFDRQLLRQDLRELFDRYIGIPLKNLRLEEAVHAVSEIMVRHQFVLPTNLALMIKAISIVENSGRRIYPELDIFAIAAPFTEKILKEKFSLRELIKKIEFVFEEGLELAEQLPHYFSDIFNKLKDGKLKISLEHRGLDELNKEISRASSRVSLSLITAALIVGASLILQTQTSSFDSSLSVLGLSGYILATLLGLGLIISILRSKK